MALDCHPAPVRLDQGLDDEEPQPRALLVPGGEPRFVQRAEGIRWMIVNGEILLADGKYSGALPGRVVRPFALR